MSGRRSGERRAEGGGPERKPAPPAGAQPDAPAVEPHKQCPRCHQGLGGVGQSNGRYAKASSLHVRYYRCDVCGHTWSVRLRPEQIVSVETRPAEDLEAR